MNEFKNIPQEKFAFVNEGEKLSDKQFEDKPIGYFKDAWIRFRKNKASVIATVIIICIILFSFLAPLLETKYDHRFMDTYYSKKGPRNLILREMGIADGGMDRDFSEKGLIMSLAIGIGAEDWDDHDATLAEGLESKYQPMLEIGEGIVSLDALKKEKTTYPGRVDTYLDVGFLYRSIEQSEYHKIVAFEEETGIKVLYPLVENNEYTPDPNNANYWYKRVKNQPVSTDATGDWDYITYADLQEGVPLEDNYKRDAEGNVKYYEFTGGGTADTAQYKVRVLYHNYYVYQNGFEPEYLFGTDSQGYDLMLRLAGAIQLSLFVAVCVSVINFTLGALYGSTEGYYGGVIDLTMERISDILAGVPFIVVATLFQIHLSAKVGAIPSLLFAFVLTGWIGTASRVRTQFYRFKNQEFVLLKSKVD